MLDRLTFYTSGVRRGLNSTDLEVFKHSIFMVLMIPTVLAVTAHVGIQVISRLFLNGTEDPEFYTFLLFLPLISVYLGFWLRKKWLVDLGPHLLTLENIAIALLIITQFQDLTFPGMLLVTFTFTTGFIMDAKWIPVYVALICFSYILVGLDTGANTAVTEPILILLLVFVGLISFLFSFAIQNMVRNNHRQSERIKLLYENDKQIFGTLAHGLKTPLTALKLEVTAQQPDATIPVIVINNFIEDIADITNRLGSLAKIQLGSVSAESETTDLKVLLKEICVDAQMLASNYEKLHSNKRKVIWKPEIDGPRALTVLPAAQLRETILNLLDNSIRHSDEKEKVTVWVELSRIGKFYVITISDDGVGMSRAYLNKLLAGNILPDDDNYRVGLVIARNIVRDIGGKFSINSVPKFGTTVEILLPIA